VGGSIEEKERKEVEEERGRGNQRLGGAQSESQEEVVPRSEMRILNIEEEKRRKQRRRRRRRRRGAEKEKADLSPDCLLGPPVTFTIII